MDAAAPLDGIVVVDLTRALAGPHAAMMLGDLGARVIKVESPGSGDDSRRWGPPFVGPDGAPESTYFLSANRNKESVVFDLKDESGATALRQLACRSDVLIENFRPGVLDRLGLSMKVLHEINPRLVVLSITGFGHDGPEGGRAGYDQIAQGEGGLMSLTGTDASEPTRVGVPIADLLAGIYGAFGIMVALHERAWTGRGRVVRTSLLAAMVGVHAFQGTRWTVAGEVPAPQGNHHPSISPYGMFRAADGFLQLSVASEQLWRAFAPMIGLALDDERFATNGLRVNHRDELTKLIEKVFGDDSVDSWLGRLSASGIPSGRVRTLDEVYEWEQTRSQGLVIEVDHPTLGHIALPGPPLRFDGAPPTRHRPPPRLGEHTEAVLAWLREGT